ncbi:hypothetical protein C4D60_Mb10t26810 [Musa balbisiana]|uniref:BAH domain-containing protein n=1 Tax=Musa balbisiana TaxID=52838 RepID=A0A4S8J0Y0_MUSBA|nr:hypothetical protein C4D60_Mb10t26810 [Musa balbisiana]
MAKTKPGKKDLDSYTIKSTNKVVKVGDCVLMRPAESGKPPYVARVEKIEADHRNNVRVRVRWYYRPEESIGGRRQFHGAKELFLSDHYDVQSAHTIEGKCIVHSFKNYTKLENVGAEDYFCRFEYKAATGAFTPDRIAVYCKCEMPYNPDDLMVQCEGCKDWQALGRGEARPERLANLPGGTLQTGAAWALARAQALGASGERLGCDKLNGIRADLAFGHGEGARVGKGYPWMESERTRHGVEPPLGYASYALC